LRQIGGKLKDGFSVSGNQLVKVIDGKTIVQKIEDKVINVIFQ
jgi:hypothetical protein